MTKENKTAPLLDITYKYRSSFVCKYMDDNIKIFTYIDRLAFGWQNFSLILVSDNHSTSSVQAYISFHFIYTTHGALNDQSILSSTVNRKWRNNQPDTAPDSLQFSFNSIGVSPHKKYEGIIITMCLCIDTSGIISHRWIIGAITIPSNYLSASIDWHTDALSP